MDGELRISNGKLFQMDGAECLKAFETIFVLNRGIASLQVSVDERSTRRGVSTLILDDRYDGSPACRALYLSVATLKSLRYLTESQCNSLNVFVILIRPRCCVTTLAREL